MTWRSLFYAKVQIKSDKLTPFGGIIKIMELFNILFDNLPSLFSNLPFADIHESCQRPTSLNVTPHTH